ncbi:DUF975 family protein [Dellaglioa carnosa]|uniref:DUF975 family protein n=1 Tax=Dellaglioa carnosa TaxID=2995136 RepID=A0ABT4JL72_9LACO|nr:DUF975 family protein [Dellaglioa carnosa]MCZ2490716.1 DUF975 family protein [Dellaglioa carnosa]MCZ2493794.1 DUF975 family protein [Dellaglioa carnosa]MDK1730658.1 DUF975 family protein [Dellaglioa carnosa]
MMDKQLKTRKQLKSETKTLFKGNWKSAILISLIGVLAYIVYLRLYAYEYSRLFNSESGSYVSPLNLNPTVSALMIFLVLIFEILLMGASYAFLTWVSSKKTPDRAFTQSFQVFSNELFFSTIALAILKTIYTIFWYLLLFFPAIIKHYSYSQAFMINKDLQDNPNHPDIKTNKKITLSRQLMNGHKFDLFVLDLSLLGWYLLSLITLGIGFIWFLPYQKAVKANFYRDLAGDQFLTLK